MTYFGFLLVFLVIPIILFSSLQLWLAQRGAPVRDQKIRKAIWIAMGVQIALALIYTTPWDNHLVATAVWGYSPKMVTGVTLGYVPLEEYIFFVLETLLVGLWWQLVRQRTQATASFLPSAGWRQWSAVAVAALWLVSTALFFSGWKLGTYLSITLAWALPPIILQLAYGADVLWHERRLVAAVILPLGLYLSLADSLAIRAGIWAIDPAQSTGLLIGGLPIEEAIFFFVTVILITFGLTLTLSKESQRRFRLKQQHLRRETRAA
jgi:lycopene cyclase domain-containing protein